MCLLLHQWMDTQPLVNVIGICAKVVILLTVNIWDEVVAIKSHSLRRLRIMGLLILNTVLFSRYALPKANIELLIAAKH